MVGMTNVYLCKEFVFMWRTAEFGPRGRRSLSYCACLVFVFSFALLFQAHCLCFNYVFILIMFFSSGSPTRILEPIFQIRQMRNVCNYYLLAKQTENSTFFTSNCGDKDASGYIPVLNNFRDSLSHQDIYWVYTRKALEGKGREGQVLKKGRLWRANPKWQRV